MPEIQVFEFFRIRNKKFFTFLKFEYLCILQKVLFDGMTVCLNRKKTVYFF